MPTTPTLETLRLIILLLPVVSPTYRNLKSTSTPSTRTETLDLSHGVMSTTDDELRFLLSNLERKNHSARDEDDLLSSTIVDSGLECANLLNNHLWAKKAKVEANMLHVASFAYFVARFKEKLADASFEGEEYRKLEKLSETYLALESLKDRFRRDLFLITTGPLEANTDLAANIVFTFALWTMGLREYEDAQAMLEYLRNRHRNYHVVEVIGFLSYLKKVNKKNQKKRKKKKRQLTEDDIHSKNCCESFADCLSSLSVCLALIVIILALFNVATFLSCFVLFFLMLLLDRPIFYAFFGVLFGFHVFVLIPFSIFIGYCLYSRWHKKRSQIQPCVTTRLEEFEESDDGNREIWEDEEEENGETWEVEVEEEESSRPGSGDIQEMMIKHEEEEEEEEEGEEIQLRLHDSSDDDDDDEIDRDVAMLGEVVLNPFLEEDGERWRDGNCNMVMEEKRQ